MLSWAVQLSNFIRIFAITQMCTLFWNDNTGKLHLWYTRRAGKQYLMPDGGLRVWCVLTWWVERRGYRSIAQQAMETGNGYCGCDKWSCIEAWVGKDSCMRPRRVPDKKSRGWLGFDIILMSENMAKNSQRISAYAVSRLVESLNTLSSRNFLNDSSSVLLWRLHFLSHWLSGWELVEPLLIDPFGYLNLKR